MIPNSNSTKQEIIALLKSNQPARAKDLCLRYGKKAADPHLLVLLANAHLALGETDAAIESVQKAIQRGWNDPNSLVLLVALLVNRGKARDADRYFTRLLKQVPGEAAASKQVASVLSRLGDGGNALNWCQRAVAAAPDDLQALVELAGLLQGAKRYEEAIDCYEKALAIRSDNAQLFCNQAMCLANIKRFDNAAEVLERAVVFHPSDPLVHFYLGETYQNQNRFHDAIASYRRALELNPRAAALHGSLARALRSLGDLDAALASLRDAQQLEPDNATVYHDMGICLYDDTDLAPAMQAFTEAVRLNPDNAQSQFYLGMIYAQSGNPAKAEELFTSACRLWPYIESFVESYRYASESGAHARYLSTGRQIFEDAVSRSPVEGLFLEFGVYHGTSINIIARLTKNTVYGFDTFQGLPSDWVVSNGQSQEVERSGSYSTHGRLPEVPENVKFEVGTFEETLPGFCAQHKEPVSFMNIDCDLYGSTKTIFEQLKARIEPGTVIVFDEYFCFPGWRDHEFKAFQEFIADTGLDYEYLSFNFFTAQAAVRISKN